MGQNWINFYRSFKKFVNFKAERAEKIFSGFFESFQEPEWKFVFRC